MILFSYFIIIITNSMYHRDDEYYQSYILINKWEETNKNKVIKIHFNKFHHFGCLSSKVEQLSPKSANHNSANYHRFYYSQIDYYTFAHNYCFRSRNLCLKDLWVFREFQNSMNTSSEELFFLSNSCLQYMTHNYPSFFLCYQHPLNCLFLLWLS